MRVLFYLGEKEWSGCARVTLVAARGLAARGHTVTIACCADSRLDTDARAAGIETVPINAGGTAAGGAWDLRKVIKDRLVEVVIVSTDRDQLIVSSARLFADRGAVLRRIPSFEGLELQRGGRLALKMAASGIVVSTPAEIQIADQAGWVLPPAVAPLGVDPSAYDDIAPASRSDMGVPPEGVLIACNYDESGRYRVATIFRTLALIGPRHLHLHVAVFGPGSLDEALRMHASALGVGSLVSFLGETEDPRRVMRAADVGWVVSGKDNAAFACLDFMALRMPVIADRSPLTQHYVADGITGTLLSPGEASYTASSIAAFLSSDDKLTAMGNAARTRVQRDFPESAMIDGFEKAVVAAGDRTQWTRK
jgi:glycosyltransferase involved in cell wall biosynthesis